MTFYAALPAAKAYADALVGCARPAPHPFQHTHAHAHARTRKQAGPRVPSRDLHPQLDHAGAGGAARPHRVCGAHGRSENRAGPRVPRVVRAPGWSLHDEAPLSVLSTPWRL